jgi:prepilin-type N-terminal cleavage/methylation domain-containing protein
MKLLARNFISTRTTQNRQSGFSMVELMVVIVLTTIMTTAIVMSFRGSKHSYAADDEAMKMLSFFREGYQRALSQRQAQRITIDRQNNLVKLTDMGTLPGGDEMLINRGVLNTAVSMDQPMIGSTVLPPPPAPYNYTPAAFDVNGVLDIYFLADGSVTNATGYNSGSPAPISLTIFFSPSAGSAMSTGQSQNNAGSLMRAVTLYGPTSSAKFWRFDGAKFIWEIN